MLTVNSIYIIMVDAVCTSEDLTGEKWREDKACLCKDNGKQDCICCLAMLRNDGAQVLVKVQDKFSQTCISKPDTWIETETDSSMFE